MILENLITILLKPGNMLCFYNTVILGNQHRASEPEELIAAPKDYHFVIGQFDGYLEYIVLFFLINKNLFRFNYKYII